MQVKPTKGDEHEHEGERVMQTLGRGRFEGVRSK